MKPVTCVSNLRFTFNFKYCERTDETDVAFTQFLNWHHHDLIILSFTQL